MRRRFNRPNGLSRSETVLRSSAAEERVTSRSVVCEPVGAPAENMLPTTA